MAGVQLGHGLASSWAFALPLTAGWKRTLKRTVAKRRHRPLVGGELPGAVAALHQGERQVGGVLHRHLERALGVELDRLEVQRRGLDDHPGGTAAAEHLQLLAGVDVGVGRDDEVSR